MRKNLNKLKSLSYQFRAIATHPSHQALKRESNKYGDAIILAKQQHWENFLEEMNTSEIWTANKYLKEPAGNGGLPRILPLKTPNEHSQNMTTKDNESKANLLVKTFFPPPPINIYNNIHPQDDYPEPLPNPPATTSEQVAMHIAKLLPYKAPGPDSIPNIILKECVELILTPLTNIYKALIRLTHTMTHGENSLWSYYGNQANQATRHPKPTDQLP